MTYPRVDVHAHYLGGSVAKLFDSGFTLAGGFKMSALWTPDEALSYMDRLGISIQFLSVPWTINDADSSSEFDSGFARAVNEEYAELIRQYPGRFGAFAALPGDSPDAQLEETRYALDVLGLDGVLLTSNIRGQYLGCDWYEPLLAELHRRRTPIFLHPTDSPAIVAEFGLGRPSSVCEFPFDTARNIVNAIYSGVFKRYPDLRLILAHCGGSLPTLGWRIAAHTFAKGADDADVDPAHVKDVLSKLYYETALAGSRNSVLPTLEVTTAEHILFGTDWPAAPERLVILNTEALLQGGTLNESQLSAVQADNARHLFPRLH